jgi:serine/threonine protein kinase
MTDLDRLAAALSDRYRIERELGEGGMATVYLAEDLKHSRRVAIKVLKRELAAVVGAERFLAEIRTTAQLSHPHILPLFDSGEAAGTLYYVMPLVAGESLHQRLDREGRIALPEALRITREVADALAYAHKTDVVHRDVKPENILLEGGHALVTDFGIARVVSAAEDMRLTATGLSLGTPLYMSPEQSAGDRFIDARSDVYSLASVLFEMLAGRPPFTGSTAQAILVQRFTKSAPRLSELIEGVPMAVDAAVQRALSREVEERQPTMERFAAALAEEGLRPAGPPDKSIAVLPFEDMSPGRDNEYFGDGIAEEIINALTRLEGLRVAARTSAFSFKGKHEDLRTVGDKLNVATVLEGSVRKAGNRLRVTAQLVTATDGYHLWSERYDRDLTDVFAVQDEIAAAIAEKLEVTYVSPPAPVSASKTTPNVEAYDAYLKGRALLQKRGLSLQEALACFERAVELDPSSARAHAGLGDALWWLAYYHLAPRDEALTRARTSLARALEIDPDCAEVLGRVGRRAGAPALRARSGGGPQARRLAGGVHEPRAGDGGPRGGPRRGRGTAGRRRRSAEQHRPHQRRPWAPDRRSVARGEGARRARRGAGSGLVARVHGHRPRRGGVGGFRERAARRQDGHPTLGAAPLDPLHPDFRLRRSRRRPAGSGSARRAEGSCTHRRGGCDMALAFRHRARPPGRGDGSRHAVRGGARAVRPVGWCVPGLRGAQGTSALSRAAAEDGAAGRPDRGRGG